MADPVTQAAPAGWNETNGPTVLLLAERISHERELRELSQRAIEHERELRMVFDQHERELRLIAAEAVEKARQIQFDEYERRLTTLNHAHEQAVEAQRLTVPRETFDNYVREQKVANELALTNVTNEVTSRQAEVDRRLTNIEKIQLTDTGSREGASATIRWAFAAVAALSAIVGLILLVPGGAGP